MTIFGKGVTSAKPGSAPTLMLAVDDIDAARNDLITRGWYAPYLSARQHGSTPEEASAAADRYMEKILNP